MAVLNLDHSKAHHPEVLLIREVHNLFCAAPLGVHLKVRNSVLGVVDHSRVGLVLSVRQMDPLEAHHQGIRVGLQGPRPLVGPVAHHEAVAQRDLLDVGTIQARTSAIFPERIL